MKRRDFLAGSLSAAVAGAGGRRAFAQDYPSKPVKVLVSTAPGGMADTLGRLLASHLTQTMGQQFYVENRGGAGKITSNHIMYKKMPYDVLRDLAPITQLVSLPNVLVVNPSQPYKTLAEFIAAAKQMPGKINFASAGVGSNLHLSM